MVLQDDDEPAIFLRSPTGQALAELKNFLHQLEDPLDERIIYELDLLAAAHKDTGKDLLSVASITVSASITMFM